MADIPGGTGAPINNILETVRRVTQTQIDTIIYVDPAGDDANDGLTTGTAVQTLREASHRVPLLGEGNATGPCRVNLAAGTYILEDVFGAQGTFELADPLRFASISDIIIDGTAAVTVVDTVTVGSVSGQDITMSPSPGWTPGEHIGKRANWDVFGGPSFFQSNTIIGNTVDTITVAVTHTGIGGFIPMPSPTDTLRIETPGAVIQAAATNPTSFTNAVQYNGSVLFQNIGFDANGTNAECVIDQNGGSNALFVFCDFINGPRRGVIVKGRGYFYSCFFDGCTSAGVEGAPGSFIRMDGDCVYKNCFAGVTGNSSFIQLLTTSTWSLSNTIIYEAKNGADIQDLTVQLWADGGGTYVRLETGRGFYFKDKRPLLTFAGHTAIARVFDASKGNSFFDLVDVDNYDVTPTVAFIEFPDNVQASQAEFISGTPPSSPGRTVSAAKSIYDPSRSVVFYES